MEVNKIYQICKTFEDQFELELMHLLEYKVELTDRSTFFVEDEDP